MNFDVIEFGGMTQRKFWYGLWCHSTLFTNMKLPAGELFPQVSKFCLNEWQEIWDCCEGNKLHFIYPTVGFVEHSKNISYYDSALINRLRIGHSRLTHSHTLFGDDPPTCQSCGLPVSVKHILVECVGLRDIRTKFLRPRPLLLGSYFKVSTILPLLILLKKPIFITNCNACYFNLYQLYRLCLLYTSDAADE